MDKQDLEDVLLIARGVLERYLSDDMAETLANEIGDSIRDNWYTLQIMRKRKTETRGDGKIVRCKDCGEHRKDGYCERHHFEVTADWFCADGYE